MTGRPRLAFYGDDLTGSTDVMEALATRGLPTVLFTRLPTAEEAARFGDRPAVGVAGTSRSESPAWMDAHLPDVFRWMRDTGAEICHYKICSTFDSSPTIGSIGRAIDIGAAVFDQPMVPVVVGAPQLKRYTAFGTLFAGFRGETFRIDRHPVMRRHPVTPMDEADLRLHLAGQTERSVGLVDLTRLQPAAADAPVDAIAATAGIVLFDVLDAVTQARVGHHLWRLRDRARLVVGSSGVEYALNHVWSDDPDALVVPATDTRPAARMAVVSGSCSPTTERQIRHALAHGFEGLPLDHALLAGPDAGAVVEAAIRAGEAILARGRSVVAYTALGAPDHARDSGSADPSAGHAVGRALGRILAALVRRAGLGRAMVAGGDTSSHALQELGLYALELAVPLPQSPGSPLCRAHSADAAVDGLEIAFKGGQVGDDDYFSAILAAANTAETGR